MRIVAANFDDEHQQLHIFIEVDSVQYRVSGIYRTVRSKPHYLVDSVYLNDTDITGVVSTELVEWIEKECNRITNELYISRIKGAPQT